MIPPEKSEAVTRGLHEAFGLSEFEDIRMIKDLASVSGLSHRRSRISIPVENQHPD